MAKRDAKILQQMGIAQSGNRDLKSFRLLPVSITTIKKYSELFGSDGKLVNAVLQYFNNNIDAYKQSGIGQDAEVSNTDVRQGTAFRLSPENIVIIDQYRELFDSESKLLDAALKFFDDNFQQTKKKTKK